MTKEKFTPGPWFICEIGGTGHSVSSEGESICHTNQLTADVPIIKTGEPQRKANARLIAAAPDMYELLQRISDQPNSEIGTLRDEAVGIINEINKE